MTISLCMIVKDEAEFINKCLLSVAGVVDEIIVVDTGSTDETVFIAEEHGAKVFHYEWNGSFADARNESLSHATGDWILVMDADEEMSPGMLRYLKQIKELPFTGHRAYQFKIRNYHGDSFTEHFMPRFFMSNVGLEWSGLVHEQIVHCYGEFVETPVIEQVVIYHYGYEDHVIEAKGKSERNLALLNKSLEDEPENPFHWFNMGMVHYNQANWIAALDAFSQCVSLNPDMRSYYIPVSFSCLIGAYMMVGRVEEAWSLAQTAPEECFKYPDFLNNYGNLCCAVGEFNEAISAYTEAFAVKPMTMPFKNISSETWRPHAGLGNVYLQLNDLRRAKRHFEMALELAPDEQDLHRILKDINNADDKF